jgi:hypothetical protein
VRQRRLTVRGRQLAERLGGGGGDLRVAIAGGGAQRVGVRAAGAAEEAEVDRGQPADLGVAIGEHRRQHRGAAGRDGLERGVRQRAGEVAAEDRVRRRGEGGERRPGARRGRERGGARRQRLGDRPGEGPVLAVEERAQVRVARAEALLGVRAHHRPADPPPALGVGAVERAARGCR